MADFSKWGCTLSGMLSLESRLSHLTGVDCIIFMTAGTGADSSATSAVFFWLQKMGNALCTTAPQQHGDQGGALHSFRCLKGCEVWPAAFNPPVALRGIKVTHQEVPGLLFSWSLGTANNATSHDSYIPPEIALKSTAFGTNCCFCALVLYQYSCQGLLNWSSIILNE